MLLKPPLPPMEARLVEEIPTGPGWQYEPKWDGFRCIAFRDGKQVYLLSKAGQPLARYFPDIADALARLPEKHFVLDGELVVPVKGALSFDELQLRLHPLLVAFRSWPKRIRRSTSFSICSQRTATPI